MKLQKVSQTITPFAKISFIYEEFNKSGLSDLIDNHLGAGNMTGYQCGELFRTRFEVFFCGGEVAEDIMDTVPGHSRLCYIRANKSESMFEQICQISDWKKVEINYKSYEVASIPFCRFFEDRNYRLVVMREQSDDARSDLFTGDSFIYRSILTNDHASSEKEIIEYYNMRGASEKLFDIQNNDFGLGRLPTSEMKSDTVFLIMTDMMKNFYNYFIKKVSAVFKDIPSTSRIKRFIFKFICVAGKWIRQSRQWKLRLYTDRPYDQLQFTRLTVY